MEKLMDPDEATASVASSKRAISDNWRLGISTKPTTQVPIPPIIRITTGPAASEAPRNSTRGYSVCPDFNVFSSLYLLMDILYTIERSQSSRSCYGKVEGPRQGNT